VGTRKRIWVPVWAVAILLLTGCGVSTNVMNPPAPATQAVAIEFQPSPPAAISINSTASLTAVVKNDSSNAGVDWSLTCAVGVACGSLASPHTASGQPQVYTPPSALSSNTLSVTIAAFATADQTKNSVTALNISAFGTVLKGTYVVATRGSDISGNPYQRAGVIVLDGNGGVTGGEQTVNFVDLNTNVFSSVNDPVTGGSYFVGADGRGTLTVNTQDPTIGQQGIQTFSLVVLSSSHALVSKLDNGNLSGSSGETSVGTLDLQNSQARDVVPAKGYAFVANGTDTNGFGMALGGVFNIDSPKTISGAGSALDQVNAVLFGAGVVTPSSSASGTVSTPDSFGVFRVTLATDFGAVHLTAYPLGDGTHLKLIETDAAIGLTAGDAFSQGSATGSFTTLSTFSGNYVYGIFGRDLFNGGPASLDGAGLFSTAGGGSLTNGYLDESQLGVPLQISDGFQAAYAVGKGSDPNSKTDPEGIGRFYIPVSNATGFPDFTFSTSSNGTGSAWVFYLAGNGGPALMLDADVEPTFASGLFFGGGVGTGIAYPVVAGAPFSGSYGTILTQNINFTEVNAVGEIAAKGGALSGVVDIANAFGPVATDDSSLSGSYQKSAISNRLIGTLTDAFFVNNQSTTTLSVAFYPIDSTQGFFVENDLADSMANTISGDLTFGYYVMRTPVCQGCP